VWRAHFDCVRVLLDAGADMEMEDGLHRDSFDIAEKKTTAEHSEEIGKEMLAMLDAHWWKTKPERDAEKVARFAEIKRNIALGAEYPFEVLEMLEQAERAQVVDADGGGRPRDGEGVVEGAGRE